MHADESRLIATSLATVVLIGLAWAALLAFLDSDVTNRQEATQTITTSGRLTRMACSRSTSDT